MKKLIIISSVVTIIIIGGILYAFSSSYQGELNTDTTSSTTSTKSPKQGQSGQQNRYGNPDQITMEDFQSHNTAEDCWVLFRGGVYDVTTYLKLHPGGPAPITPTCGNLKFEEEFINFHGEKEVKSFERQTDFQGELNKEN